MIARPHKHLPLLRTDGKADINIKNILVLRAANPIRQTLLFFVAIAVVNPCERADEGKDFAEGNEDGGVDYANGRERKGGGEQCAPEDAHCNCRKELETLHRVKLRVWRTPAQRHNRKGNSTSSAL